MATLERTYNVPLRKEWLKKPKYKRAKRAVNTLRDFIARHMKSETVKIGKYANEKLWDRGIKNPPHHIQVTAVKDENGVVMVELVGAPVKAPPSSEEKKGRKGKDATEKPGKKTTEKPQDKKEGKKEPAQEAVKETSLEEELESAGEEKTEKPAVTSKPEPKKVQAPVPAKVPDKVSPSLSSKSGAAKPQQPESAKVVKKAPEAPARKP
ncbi:hypothetical protein COY95_01080 [Candidatus Woesearchaeota archaeon CG_4_10_14_0_8_um_filter_47_5]|nr:MAG: hypothetical protein COY95_01080 [Candidatus Woesearchaeota archaeon CG_4_10_14_0_8_um_filter_47_5]